MRYLGVTVPIGLGDIIYLKAMLDAVKHRFTEIKIKFHREIITSYHFDPSYNKFLDEIGKLFFSESPYVLTDEPGIPFYGMVSICNDNAIPAIKPNLQHLLCKGNPLQIDGEYIVMVTKVRHMDRGLLDARVLEMWQVIKDLSKKYKIVILGERVIEMNVGYEQYGNNKIYSIYDSIKDHVPQDRIVDLSIPALGKTSPNLVQIQQDCLTMSQAKFIVTLGIGGSFCMATAVGNTIGYRADDDPIADVVFSKDHPGTIVTKDFDRFLYALKSHL